MKYRFVSLLSILFGAFLMLVVAASQLVFFVSTIHFETNGVAPIASLEVQAGQAYELPEPQREGYSFDGWYLEPTFETSANFMVLSNQDRTLYAKWVPNLYTVTFDSNGGSEIDPISDYYDVLFEAPEQPVKLGYDFVGWYLDDDTFEEAFSFGTFPLDTVLYAKWTPTQYTITYVLDGGTLGNNSPTSYTIEDDLVVFPDASKLGYTFNGWFDNDAFFGSAIVAINPNRITDLTLYARFDVNQYTITFDTQGADPIDDITQDFGSLVTAPTDPTKRGHTFMGWLNNGEPFVFDTMPYQGAELVASWQVNSYTVTFDVNGGDPLDDTTVEVDYGTETDFNNPTRLGYQFNGWSTGEGIWDNGDEMIDSDFTLTATWSIIVYDIDYIMNFGFNNELNPDEYTVEDVVTLEEPFKEGHTFQGWFTDAEFNTPISEIPAGSTGDKTIYAKWQINTYTITLDINDTHPDGTGNATPLEETEFTVTFASTLALPTPVWRGMRFLGWEDGEGVKYSSGNLMPAKNLELSATWEVMTYDVVYYVFEADLENPDVLPQKRSYRLGETVNAATITNPGYIFNGWYDSATDELFSFGFEMTEITEPYVLYGKWTAIVYTVTYVLDGGTNDEENPETFTVEDSIPLGEPVKEGYNFGGWQSDSVTVSTVGGAVTDITLTATWSLVQYDITYVMNGGINDFENPRTYDVEDTIPLLDPTREGYNFDGWTDQNGDPISGIIAGMSGDLTLTANWTIKSYTLSVIAYTGQAASNSTKQYGATLGMTTPTRRGYAFDGWRESNGTYWDASDTMPGKNLTITGQWNLETYSVSYNLNGGTGGIGNPSSYNVTQGLSFTAPTRTGWAFVGWDVTGDNTQEFSNSFAVGAYAEDLTLKAIWTQNIYTLTYNSAGGSAVTSKTFNYAQSLDSTYFPTPNREGYYFGGWWDSSNNRWGTSADWLRFGPNNNLSLTARWSPIYYSLYLEPDNGEGGYDVGSYPTDGEIYIGFKPYKSGYNFVGWKDLESGIFYVNGDAMPPKNMTLTAQWQAN